MIRAQKNTILKDLEKKLVLLVGPRQSGKTWLAKDIAKSFPHSLYLNYDQIMDRKMMLDQSWLNRTDLLILDELHKMPHWKNYLKGVFDTKPANMRILVTGSARLDIYDNIGDSLAGRYFRHRLLPLSVAELKQSQELISIDRLLERGGFPEPYFANDPIDADRWRMQYTNSVLSSDIFEIEDIHNLKGMRLVFDLLRARVGSPISFQSLAQDVAVSPTTIKKYIRILEALFVIFTVTPFSKNIARSLLKEPKIYFFDTALVQGDEGARFENLVAVSLLKHTYGKTDTSGQEYTLQYLRTKDGHEVDFAIVRQNNIETILEAKLSDHTITKPLLKFHQKYNLPAIQLVKNLRHEHQQNEIKVLKAERYLAELFL